MHIKRCSTGLLLTGGISAAAVLLASPASAATAGTENGGEARYAGQKSLRSLTVPICYRPGDPEPVNGGGTSTQNPSSTNPTDPTTCYALSYQYDPGASTWWPSLDPLCTPGGTAGGGVPLAERIDQADRQDDWFRNDDDDWFGDKGRRFDDLIIGSVTIGIGGPTVGGTGIVGGTGNTAGGTTAGFGGVTAGGTTVGGFTNTVTNSGTTITAPVLGGAAGIAEEPSPFGSKAWGTDTSLPTCDPARLPGGDGPDGDSVGGDVIAPDSASDSGGTTETSALAGAGEQTSFAPPSAYERGWWAGWAARGQRDGEAVASVDGEPGNGGFVPTDEPPVDGDGIVSAS
ncbi:conserved exported hypothetical protein [Frankia canadensis]|uniref:Uncharacterized protein n=2 Tax=Frankia canadensis TaxID=1836972 RepID=A0A2I2KZS0_9ACTN|nr:conserved exported hypothetical protein [Frankia canadensis]SOU58448.1 conserved exported hypothetical protein [Frankia canadensis]